MELRFEIPIIDTLEEYEEIDVMLIGEPHFENDSFDYAGSHCTHGQSGTHHLPDYSVMDSDVEWDKTLYNDEQNKIIEDWINSHTSLIEERFCQQLEKDSEPDY